MAFCLRGQKSFAIDSGLGIFLGFRGSGPFAIDSGLGILGLAIDSGLGMSRGALCIRPSALGPGMLPAMDSGLGILAMDST